VIAREYQRASATYLQGLSSEATRSFLYQLTKIVSTTKEEK
jgi:hypothetical protein